MYSSAGHYWDIERCLWACIISTYLMDTTLVIAENLNMSILFKKAKRPMELKDFNKMMYNDNGLKAVQSSSSIWTCCPIAHISAGLLYGLYWQHHIEKRLWKTRCVHQATPLIRHSIEWYANYPVSLARSYDAMLRNFTCIQSCTSINLHTCMLQFIFAMDMAI